MDEPIRRCRDLDERLTPYVDNEAAPGDRRAVEAHLSKCPPCRDHAIAERTARDLIHERRSDLRCAAPPGLRARCAAHTAAADGTRIANALSPSLIFRTPASRWLPLSVAATVALAIAGVFLTGLNSNVQALATGLALDHAKCFQFKGDPSRSVDAAVLERAWQQHQGWPLVVPASASQEDLRLLTVRRCLSTDGRVAHVMYLWHGQPLSVFVLPHGGQPARLLAAIGHDTAVWSANGRTYAVLATGHPPDFSHIVEYVKSHAR
ncbi:MAG: zf-HC2 domain-containing protein [Acidobacteria bacterium]|nr:zf-HC2 domain-containing protein [Acidobacteriota bacterium]